MGTRARRPASEVGHGDAKPPVDQSGTQLGEVRLDTSMALGEISSHDEQMIEGRHGKTLDGMGIPAVGRALVGRGLCA